MYSLVFTLFIINSFAEFYSGKCGDNANYIYDSSQHNLSINGSGVMFDFSLESLPPWYNYKDDITLITISDISNIGSYAFNGLMNLSRINISNTITHVSNFAFKDCKKLFYGTIGSISFSFSNNILSITGTGHLVDFSSSTSTPWSSYSDSIHRINIAQGISSIGNFSFAKCYSCDSISLPSSLLRIGEGAFLKCFSLISVSLPSNLKSIGLSAFAECRLLTTLSIPDSVVTIEDFAFAFCSSLLDISIGYNTEKIGANAFRDCFSLTTISIPSHIKFIGIQAFSVCPNLHQVFINGKADKRLNCSNDAFLFDDDLKFISSSEYKFESFCNIPLNNAKGNSDNCIWSFDGVSGTFYINGNCSVKDNFIKDFPCFVPYINTIVFDDNVLSIGVSSFADIPSLKKVKLGNNLSRIDTSAFFNCPALNYVLYEGNKLLSCNFTFNDDTYIFGNNAQAICGKTIFKTKGTINNINWSFDFSTNTLVLTGSGSIPNYFYTKINSFFNLIVNIVIDEGITSIGLFSFKNLVSLKFISLPQSLLSINSGSFFECTSLESLLIPSYLKFIGDYSFFKCRSLYNITYYNNEEPLYCSKNAFDSTNELMKIFVPFSYSANSFCNKKITFMNQSNSKWKIASIILIILLICTGIITIIILVKNRNTISSNISMISLIKNSDEVSNEKENL